MASSIVYKIKNSTFLRAVSNLRGHRPNSIATVQRLQSDSLSSSLLDLKQVSDESSCSTCKKSTKIFANARTQSTPFSLPLPEYQPKTSFRTVTSTILGNDLPPVSTLFSCREPVLFQHTTVSPLLSRYITTVRNLSEQASQDSSAPILEMPPRIKFKRLDKTAKHIMQILDKEDVEKVKAHREIPDIKPGYIVQLKVEVPENKRRVSILKGIVIARRNAGLNTTFRLRRLVAGVGVESLFPLYSPNIKEIKVIDKKKVKRAKLYYLRDKMNALKKQ